MLKFLFKKKTQEISESESIIEKFINEHKLLVDLYVEILGLANEHKFTTIKEKLKEFENILFQHIQDEKEEIYNHLNEVLDKVKDSILLKEINQIKSEIVPIKKKISVIKLKYRELHHENINNFIEDFSYLKEPILNRIDLEEKKLFLYFKKKAKR